MAGLDTAIDELYQKPLDQFTAARNALAKTLSGADAAAVRQLAKPTAVAWAVNQLHWRARSVFERLRQSGEKVRAAQIAALKGKGADVRAAAETHRRAVADAAQHAAQLAAGAGSRPDADELARTLEALSLAKELPEPAGRLTRALQPAGFEALAGVTPAAAPLRLLPREARSPERKMEPKQREDESARKREEQAAAKRRAVEARQAEMAVRKAAAALDRAKADESQARAAWERARQTVTKAEAALAGAKALARGR